MKRNASQGIPAPQKQSEVLSYIAEHISEDLSLDRLCAALGTNRTTLAATVKKRTGLPPMQYIRLERLKMGRQALIHTDQSVRDIALSCGFEDENYFIRAFKEYTGQTPLQFRLSQWEKSPDPQKKQTLTPALFADYISRGLGRAILLLRQQENKQPYKKPFLDHVFSSREILGIYERDLLDCFEDRKELRALIGQTLLDSLKRDCNNRSSSIPLLHLLGFREEVRDIVEQHYARAHGALTEALEKGQFSFENETKDAPSPATLYMRAAGILGRFVKPGQRRMRAVLSDIADFYDYTDTPPIPCTQNPLFQIYDGMGKDAFFDIFEEICHNHKNGALLKKEFFILQSPLPAPVFRPVSLTKEEILSSIKEFSTQKQPPDEQFYVSFCACPPRIIKSVTQRVMETTDPAMISTLLFFFEEWEDHPSPPPFPLPCQELIALAKEAKERAKSEPAGSAPYKRVVISAHRVLRRMPAKAVHDYALELLEKQEQHRDGLMLLAMTYQPEDHDLLEEALRSLLLKTGHDAVLSYDRGAYILSLLKERGVKHAPYHLFYDFFKTPDRFDRYKIASLLFKIGMMTEELRNECLLDRYGATRELAGQIDPPVKNGAPLYRYWKNY